MAECYLLAVARGSSLDQSSNNWSLFTLVEQLNLPADAPQVGEKAVIPFEVHVFWQFDAQEVGGSIEFRLVSASEQDERTAKVFSLSVENQRHRVRIQGCPLLHEGPVRLGVEWRLNQSDEWKREPVFWPLVIERRAAGASPKSQESGA